MDYDLERVRRTLLHGLRVSLGPEQGWEAFERHQLLTIRFHHAARLNAPRVGERVGWRQYFDAYFPRGGEHGRLLFERWRTTLIKDEFPAAGVAITHGQRDAHWEMTEIGLIVNLESMWDDFEISVDRFVEALAQDDSHRALTLEALDKTGWTVRPVTIVKPTPTILTPNQFMISPSISTTSATASASSTRNVVDKQT